MYLLTKVSFLRYSLINFTIFYMFVVSGSCDSEACVISCFSNGTSAISEKKYLGIVQERITICINTTSTKHDDILHLNVTPKAARLFNIYGEEINLTIPMILPSKSKRHLHCFEVLFENATKYNISVDVSCESERMKKTFSYIVAHFITKGSLQITSLNTSSIYQFQTIEFFAQIQNASSAISFYWNFGDGYFEIIKKTIMKEHLTNHKYKTHGIFNLTVIALHNKNNYVFADHYSMTIEVKPVFEIHSPKTACIHKEVHFRLKSSINYDSINSWKFSNNISLSGRNLTSVVRKFDKIGLYKINVTLEGKDEKTILYRSIKIEEPLNNVKINSDNSTLPVVSFNFSLVAKTDPVGNYTYQWVTSRGNFVIVGQKNNIATFYVLRYSWDNVIVNVSNSISWKKASFGAFVMKRFDDYQVSMKSTSNFLIGHPIKITVKSTGLKYICYRLLQNGLVIQDKERRSHSTMFYLTFDKVGLYDMQVKAYMKGRPGFIERYSAEGVDSCVQKNFTIKNIMIIIGIKINGNTFLGKDVVFPTRKYLKIELLSDGYAAYFTVKICSSIHQLSGIWNKTQQRSTAMLNYYPTSKGFCKIEITASNVISQKKFTSDVEFQDVISAFQIKTLAPSLYHKVGKRLQFITMSHNGSSVSYIWDFNDGVTCITNNSLLPVEHTFNETGIFNVSVLASNDVSNYANFMAVHVFKDNSSLKWGSTRLRRNVGTNEVFPIVLTISSGLPVDVIIYLGNGQKINAKLKPHISNVFYHSYEKPGIYHVRAIASDNADKQLHLYHKINVQDRIDEINVKLNSNSTTFCVPSTIEIHGIVRKGSNVTCKITSSDNNTLYHDIAQHNLKEQHIACNATYNLTTTGYYNFTIKMYNNIDEKTAIINSIKGKHPDREPINVNVTSQETRVGKFSIMEIQGDFDCPLLKCDLDFGDGSMLIVKNVANGSFLSHKYDEPGKYNISGVCFSHHNKATFQTRALVSYPLIVNEIVYQDSCLEIGETYLVNAYFKYASLKQWRIKINGFVIANPNDIVTERGLNATIRIPSGIYGDYGDKELQISVFDDIEEKDILKTNLCIRRSTQKVLLSVVSAASLNTNVKFDFQPIDASVSGIASISFGDGDYKYAPSLKYPHTYIYKTYTTVGDFSYSWTVTKLSMTIAQGSGSIKIAKAIGNKYLYSFPTWNDLYWPNNHFVFQLSIKCPDTPPEALEYRIDFGDGEVTQWLQMPSFDCYKSAILQDHTYKEAGCYKTYMEMRNIISRESFTGRINIIKAITSMEISLNNIPSIEPIEEENNEMIEVYLKDSHPIEVIANATGSKCLTFNWKIPALSWAQNTGSKNTIVLNNLIGRNGSYILEVSVSNMMNSFMVEKRIVLMKTIVGLNLLASVPNNQDVIQFYLLLENTGTNSTFHLNFGDGTSLDVSNLVFQPAMNIPDILSIDGASNLKIANYFAAVKSHKYTAKGLFIAQVVAKDIFTTLSAKRDVYLSDNNVCKRPTVKIIREDDQILSFSFAGAFTVLTNVQVDCGDSNRVIYKWQIFNSSKIFMEKNRVAEQGQLISFPAGTVTNQRDLTIKKRTIYPGIYIIKIIVEVKGLGYSESDETYIEVTRELLHAEIIGSTTRLLSWEKDIFLDGRNSKDPNIPPSYNNSLIYKWYCRVKPGSLQFTIGNGGCFGYGDMIIEHQESTWMIPAKKLIKNAVYIIRLRIESHLVADIFADIEQFIDVRSGTVISTSIKCKANCQRNIDPETRISLIGSCLECGRYKSYQWQLLNKDDFSNVHIRWMTDTLTTQDSISFVLLPMFLTRNKEYLARFTVTTAWGEVGYADYGFKVSIPPQGGFCNVTPPYGEAIKTKFHISCHNWSGSTQTLQYSIGILEYTFINNQIVTSETLISYGAISFIQATLQQGQEKLNYSQTLKIRISDSYGASTETNLTVQVEPFNAKDDNQPKPEENPIENQLETYIYGSGSTLSKLSGTGDVQELGRFTKAIGKSLDSAKKQSLSMNISKEEKKKRAAKRENMRTTIVNSLTEITVTNLDTFAVVNSALKDVSSSEDEINPGSQDKMLQFFEDGSKFLKESYDDWGERDPKEIQNAFQGFLEGVGNIIESATTTSISENVVKQRSNEQHKKFTEDSLKIIDNSTILLSRSLVVGETARRINGESLSIEMKTSETGKLNSTTIKTLDGGQLRAPSARSFIDIDNTDITTIESKMVTLLRNPHILDKENIGRTLTPKISSVKFLSGEAELNVTNLPNEDQMMIEVPNPDAQMVNTSGILKNGTTRLVLLQLPAKEVTFFMKIQCFGAPCDVFINYDSVASPSNYTETFSITDSIYENNQSYFGAYDSLSSTKFSIGIMYNASNSSTSSSLVKFDLEAFVSGCFFWDQIENKWSSWGCKMSNRTTLRRTICECNHLTWFGGGFLVQPNVLDITTEILKIKDIADHPALLATVCVIFGCYLIAVIWARRQDKIDNLKATLVIPDDCCRSHKFRYDLTISSGSRPGSGTTASICIIIGGSLSESNPFCLSHHSDILFQRGSIDSFLVTSEKDLGEIKYIRLWHDNTGKSPSWFVSRINVTNILTGKQTQFLCNSWLSLENGMIDTVFVASEENELKSFEAIFLNKTSSGFSDDHIWFSISMRPPRSHFTRVQRVTCCLCALLCTMLTNAMFYQRANKSTNIKIGSFSFNWKQIIIGVQSALIVLPINVLIVALFRKAAPNVKKLEKDNSDSDKDTDASQSIEEFISSTNDINMDITVVECSETSTNGMNTTNVTDMQYPFMNMLSEDTLDLIHVLNKNEDENSGLSDHYHSFENVGDSFQATSHSQFDHKNVFIDIVKADDINLINTENVILEIDEDEIERTIAHGNLLSQDTMELINHLNVKEDAEHTEDRINNLDRKSENSKLGGKESFKMLESSNSHGSSENAPSNTIEENSAKKEQDGTSCWPRFFHILAWFLCSAATVTSAFFTLLYGLSFGRKIQEEWLLSFFTSVFQDIFISQPAKVLIVGCVFGLILKKITEDDTLPEVQFAKDDEWVNKNLPFQEKGTTSSKINIPLTPSFVKKAHAQRLKDMKLIDLTLEIITYLFYIFLILLIAYGHRPPNSYDMTSNLESLIITEKFDQINNTKDFWQWTYTTFLPSIYGEVWYNDNPTNHNGFLSDYVTYLIGTPRLRQLRVVTDKCIVSPTQYDVGRSICSGEYTSSNEDKTDYKPGWKMEFTNETINDSRIEQENPWLYHSQLELSGHPFIADLQSYSGGGYTISLGKSLSQATSSIDYLNENLWIDTYTRAVFIEFTTYNNNNNFYCIVTLLLEFTQDGGAFPFTRIITTRLDRYNSDFSYFLAACEISFLLLTLYYSWLELKKFRRISTLYFKQWGSLIELLLFSLTWATFALLIVRFGVVKWTKNKYRDDPNQFINFQYAASTDLAYGYTLACLVFIAFLKILKILRFNKNMSLLYKTLQFASKDLRYYGFLFSIPMFGYIQWAYLSFGQQLIGYATYLRSSMSVINLLLGSANFYDLQSANRIIGPIFFIIFVVTMGFVLMNMFLSIVMQAFSEVRRLMAKEKNKYEIIEFLYAKVIRFFPCLQGKKRRKRDLIHNKTKVDEYYQKRMKGRQNDSFESYKEDRTYETVISKLDKVEEFVNRCLLSEYEELEELSEFALKLRRKLRKEQVDD